MIQGLYSALSAIVAGDNRISLTANNIANVNSTSYKSQYSVLSELSKGGVKVISVNSDKSQGYLIHTGRNLDLAINGNGYFKVYGENGENLTREGNFYLDKNREIVNANGERLTDGLNLNNNDEISIDTKGNLLVNGQKVFKIDIFSDNDKPVPENSYEIIPGFLEASNVDLAKEIVNNIVDLRYVQANTKTIKTTDEMLGYILDIKS
ncbi:flagellar hook-basal body complex protein [Deferribacterales bacterium Es71-Z0220]|uniref:flagellar hook-basal body protein n=1 Tax=Deferrivibrio essentukiensis TaxID=2880922 RepID=UPI001F60D0C3|nr:flagellar hook-basal body complex protein [Deferrivibrio essentukiensis]MCB4203624.1 flagellar hook-basal body complex protein [Deferrivibrio essentukiensis]